MRRLALFPLLVLAALACGGQDDALPRGVSLRPRPATADTTRDCPDLSGEYWVERGLAWNLLVHGRLSDEARRIAWSRLEIRGGAVIGLDLVVRHAEIAETLRVERGRDYRCASGWLVPLREVGYADLRAEDSTRIAGSERHHRFEFGLAGVDGDRALGRLRTTSFAQFDVWCGDGCRGFPLPWTFDQRSDWELLIPTSQAPSGEPSAPADVRAMSEERLLEYGPDAAKPAPIEKWVRAMLPPGGELKAITPSNGGYRLSVTLPSDSAVATYVGLLINTQGLRGAHEMKSYGGWSIDPPRRYSTVVWVPRGPQ